jgi:hypothetical protein
MCLAGLLHTAGDLSLMRDTVSCARSSLSVINMAMSVASSITLRAAPLAAKRSLSAAKPMMMRACAARKATLRTSAPVRMAYTSEPKGDFPSLDYRIFFKDDGKTVSPWHDIPLRNADGTFNAIIEIPKESKAKVWARLPPPFTCKCHLDVSSDACTTSRDPGRPHAEP